jgi:hypothetical protein
VNIAEVRPGRAGGGCHGHVEKPFQVHTLLTNGPARVFKG